MLRVAVLSDTHSPRRWKGLPPLVARQLMRADVILHAGDVCTPDVLDLLAEFAPVHAVLGNNDVPEVAAWGAPETLQLSLGGVSLAMIHDSGPATGRAARLRRRFPAAKVVVFGHSHIPMDVTEQGLHVFNPGSPTDRRRQPHGTVGTLTLEDGQVTASHIVAVTP